MAENSTATQLQNRAQHEVQIRVADMNDCEALASLAGQLGYESSAQEIARRFEGVVQSPENAVFVAQKISGRVVGWISAYVFRPLTSDARVEISGLVVDEAHRSRKIGAILLKRAEEWAVAQGCRSIGVHTNTTRQRAHAFYEQNGYQLAKTQRFYRKSLTD
ncbi:MAG TPA: GNAT family N-acetyltransferase [Candidatus Acidoferrales bacterium]|nr:GNAT family N-acetyltransferase [Candidatus Acidoferrales bacterium]